MGKRGGNTRERTEYWEREGVTPGRDRILGRRRKHQRVDKLLRKRGGTPGIGQDIGKERRKHQG